MSSTDLHSSLAWVPAGLSRRRLALALGLAGLGAACGGGGGSSGGGGGGGGGGGEVPPGPPVAGPAWWGFGRDTQHAATGAIATQDLNRISWQKPMDLDPQFSGPNLLAHYGTPVVSSNNTVVMPVKTGATGGFRVEARSGSNGGLIWQADSDYVLPAHNWTPAFNIALSSSNRLHAPGAGGKLFLRDNVDSATGSLRSLVFYGASVYAAAQAQFDASVFIHTPVTVDAAGNAWFGFIALASNPGALRSGIARVGADGSGVWAAATDLAADAAIQKVAMNCAPALSADGNTVYVAVNTNGGSPQRGMLLALDSRTLALKFKVDLIDPASGTFAWVSDDGTSSPTVGPDGDVYYGVLEAFFPNHNARGWLLHFDANLAGGKAPGSFGWDDTASIVPASMVPSYTGSSSYLLATKYNNYIGVGSGDGKNRMAVLDPHDTQADSISSASVMKEVLTVLGVTPETAGSSAVKEWCVNTVAVDPLTHSILVNSEDGYLYRWDLHTNSLSQKIRLTGGLGEAYTPTAIGADGAVYAVNRAVLFSIAR